MNIEPPTPEEIDTIKKVVALLSPEEPHLRTKDLRQLPALLRILQIIVYQHDVVLGLAEIFERGATSSGGLTDLDVDQISDLIDQMRGKMNAVLTMAGREPIQEREAVELPPDFGASILRMRDEK